jgi:hypothetical protein
MRFKQFLAESTINELDAIIAEISTKAADAQQELYKLRSKGNKYKLSRLEKTLTHLNNILYCLKSKTDLSNLLKSESILKNILKETKLANRLRNYIEEYVTSNNLQDEYIKLNNLTYTDVGNSYEKSTRTSQINSFISRNLKEINRYRNLLITRIAAHHKKSLDSENYFTPKYELTDIAHWDNVNLMLTDVLRNRMTMWRLEGLRMLKFNLDAAIKTIMITTNEKDKYLIDLSYKLLQLLIPFKKSIDEIINIS